MNGCAGIDRGDPRLAAVALLGALLLAGCEPAPLPVRLQNRAAPLGPVAAERTELTLLPVIDGRPRDEGATGDETRLGGAVVTRDSLAAWIEAELRRQLDARYRLVASDAPPAQGQALRVRVAACYARPIGGQMSAQVVLEVEWFDGAEVRSRTMLRGQRVGAIWWSAQLEVGSALRLALEDAVRQLAKPAD
ncbi:MAG TPA: hypothetical protein VK178_12315 [Opitutaceae bacterium]|nr:hypothetical protein [Opitutaceae bacterium]